MESSSPLQKQYKVPTLTKLKTLSKGAYPVYHVHYVDYPSRKIGYALKVFSKGIDGILSYNKEKLLEKFDHPNVIRYVPIAVKTKDFNALLTEFAPYGDLFEWVINDALNEEVLIRTYFHQLIEGLEHIHSQGIAHLDVKLENVMIGEEFQLKIIDFDNAQFLKDRWITSKGTLNYRAPEVTNKVCRNLAGADIYSAGVTLFVLATKEYPFKNESFDAFVHKNEDYWKAKLELKNSEMLSRDFIELMNGILEPKPEKRFTIEQIKKSSWYNKPILDSEDLKIEMKLKWELLIKIRRMEKMKDKPLKKHWGKSMTAIES